MLKIVALVKIAREYLVPSVLSTGGVRMGVNQGTIPELKESIPGARPITALARAS